MRPIVSAALLTIFLLLSCKKEIAPDSFTQIDAWGDSLTYGQGSTDGQTYPYDLQKLSNIKVYNYGISGQTSTQVRDRMLTKSSHGDAAIIWVGRNNYGDPVQVKADIDTMVKRLASKRYLVLGILNGDDRNEWKGNPGYELIIALNHDLANIYGNHFIDIRSYLVSSYDKSSPADSLNMTDDVVPASLRADFLHLNNKGYQLVAKRIYQKIAMLEN
jgi:lysophospholipase L1-like esterase